MKKLWLFAFAGIALAVGIAALIVLTNGTGIRTVTSSIWPAEVLDISFLSKHSESVVIGHVVEILPARWDTPDGTAPLLNMLTNGASVYTDVIVQVDRTVKGSVPSTVVVRTLGGKIGGYSVIVEDEAKFEVGEKVLLLLTKEGPLSNNAGDDGVYWVTGSMHGKFTITSDNQAVRYDIPEQYQKIPLQEVLDSVTGQ